VEYTNPTRQRGGDGVGFQRDAALKWCVVSPSLALRVGVNKKIGSDL
jgi:hypothetical protein